MKVKKVLNNNAVTVLNDNNEEIVVTGLGLAFKKKAGDEVEKEKIERIFTLKSKEVSEKLNNLISGIPIKHIEITEKIIHYSEEKLEKKLNENIYLTLTDHVNFAISRYKQGLKIINPMYWEIRRLYKEEFSIGLKALQIIKEELDIYLPEEEGASIALHFVNAQLNEGVDKIMDITNIINEILNIIKYHFGVNFDEESLNYHRLVTHLKFFVQRMLNKKLSESKDDYLYNIVKKEYSDSYACAGKIRQYIYKQYNFIISCEEMTYLMIHIHRVVHRDDEK